MSGGALRPLTLMSVAEEVAVVDGLKLGFVSAAEESLILESKDDVD